MRKIKTSHVPCWEAGNPNWSNQGSRGDLSAFKEAALLGTPIDTLQALYPKVFKNYPGVVREFVIEKRYPDPDGKNKHGKWLTVEKEIKKTQTKASLNQIQIQSSPK